MVNGALILLALACAPAGGQEPVTLTAPASALLASPLTVRAAARLNPGETLALDLERSTTETFAITEVKELSGSPGKVFELTILPLDIGRRSFPLYWILSAAGSKRSLATPLQLEIVVPPEAAQARDLKDIKPPARARPALWPWLLLAAAILGAWVWDMRRAMRAGRIAAAGGPEPDPRPFEAIAADDLSRLEASGLWAEGRHAEFYAELTDILRRYLERRYAFPATTQTTTEIHRQLRRRPFDRRLLALSKDLCERADLVKFAKVPAQRPWGAEDLAAARRLVRETSPRELTPAQDKAPAAKVPA